MTRASGLSTIDSLNTVQPKGAKKNLKLVSEGTEEGCEEDMYEKAADVKGKQSKHSGGAVMGKSCSQNNKQAETVVMFSRTH